MKSVSLEIERHSSPGLESIARSPGWSGLRRRALPTRPLRARYRAPAASFRRVRGAAAPAPVTRWPASEGGRSPCRHIGVLEGWNRSWTKLHAHPGWNSRRAGGRGPAPQRARLARGGSLRPYWPRSGTRFASTPIHPTADSPCLLASRCPRLLLALRPSSSPPRRCFSPRSRSPLRARRSQMRAPGR